MSWSEIVALFGLCALPLGSACHPAVEAPTSPAPTASAASSPRPSSPARHDAPPVALSAERVRACLPSPALVERPDCGLRSKLGEGPALCVDFAPAGSPDVDVLSIVVAPAPFDFAAALGIPSMQTMLDGGTPDLAAMKAVYRDFEGPHPRALADGRHVTLEARGLMLGGVVHWATLRSPGGSFDSVVVRTLPLHDAPLADADRKAVEAWDLARIAECLDAVFWRRPKRP